MNFKLYSASYAGLARYILNLRTLYIWYVLLKLNGLKLQYQRLLKPCAYVEIKCQLDATEVASSWHFISTY